MDSAGVGGGIYSTRMRGGVMRESELNLLSDLIFFILIKCTTFDKIE